MAESCNMSVATSGPKNAVLDELAGQITIGDDTRAALEKLNIREILALKRDILEALSGDD